MELYKLCEKYNIPITAHCSGASVHTSKKRIKDIPGIKYILEEGYVDKVFSKRFYRKQDYATFFNHPRNWVPVLKKFPNIKLNLAHFGGDKEWKEFLSGKSDTWVSQIIELMENYPNLYSDFSYTMHNSNISIKLKLLISDNKLIRSRVLYGSDYYMIVREGHFRDLKIKFNSLMGDDIMREIAMENPMRFLFG